MSLSRLNTGSEFTPNFIGQYYYDIILVKRHLKLSKKFETNFSYTFTFL